MAVVGKRGPRGRVVRQLAEPTARRPSCGRERAVRASSLALLVAAAAAMAPARLRAQGDDRSQATTQREPPPGPPVVVVPPAPATPPKVPPATAAATPDGKAEAHDSLDGDVLPSKPRSGWAALPVASYSPETSLGVGAFATHFFRLGKADAETRPSSFSLVGLFTLRKQVITEAIPELYWDHERWHLWSKLDYRRYPNKLWAVGHRSPGDSEERYLEKRPRLQVNLGREIGGRLFLYGYLEMQQIWFENLEDDGLLDRHAVVGADGGRTVGVGPTLRWDTRDHLLTPHRGFFHELSIKTYQPMLGSEYRFNSLVLNLRSFIPVIDDHVWVLQYFAHITEGEVPFFLMPQLGGQFLLRGYYEGRFRDKVLMAVQTEYRFPLFWRFGGVLHAALGDVAPSLLEFAPDPPEWSLGCGLRIMLNRAERLNLRADLGVGRDTWGFYVGIAEAI